MRRYGFYRCFVPILIGLMLIFVPSCVVIPIIGAGLIIFSLLSIIK